MNTKFRYIVGIDYGTTYTGVSYIIVPDNARKKSRVNDIVIQRDWPRCDGNWKTPTVIAYSSENRHLNTNAWGYQVTPTQKSCSWTKLLLDTSKETTQFDDPSLREATGGSLLRLPPGKSAQIVCQDFLKEIYDFITNKVLKAKLNEERFDETPIEFYLTMPAIWSDQAQKATMDAAKAAGFGSRPSDKIWKITEPEAAAIATLRGDLRPNSVNAAKPGDNILILDCGGGTVDITTYTINSMHPRIEFDEICTGIGGKCGSTWIDRNFHELMVKRFGPAFQNVKPHLKAPGSIFMKDFERAKQGFGSSDDEDEMFRIETLNMEGVDMPDYYDEDVSTVILSRDDMVELFNPVITAIFRLVGGQVKKARNEKGKKIGLIVLVGGFGNSHYLKARLDAWCRKNDMTCIRPDHCQAAVVRGAAIRGLEGIVPSKIICRRHYGFAWGKPFREGVDDEKDAYWTFGRKFCHGFMEWMMAKGSELTATTSSSVDAAWSWTSGKSRIFHCKLYTCNSDIAPERLEDSTIVPVGGIKMDFTNVDMSIFEKRSTSSGTEYWLEYELKTEFRSEDGMLKFSSIVGESIIGTTSIDFHD